MMMKQLFFVLVFFVVLALVHQSVAQDEEAMPSSEKPAEGDQPEASEPSEPAEPAAA